MDPSVRNALAAAARFPHDDEVFMSEISNRSDGSMAFSRTPAGKNAVRTIRALCAEVQALMA